MVSDSNAQKDTEALYEGLIEVAKKTFTLRPNLLNEVQVREIEETENSDGYLELKLGNNTYVMNAKKLETPNDANNALQKRELNVIYNWIMRTRFLKKDGEQEK